MTAPVRPAHATGYYGPEEYLADGGSVTATPEFFWELEVKRLARDFHPPEKLLAAQPVPSGDDDSAAATASLEKRTADADIKDFADALRDGSVKPPDAGQASAQQEAARAFIAAMNDKTTAPLPSEFDSEFADYHRGAYAYRLGKAHWDEAQKSWEGLLNRPAAERRYRSVWAAFMLGKLAMKEGNPDAVKWFKMSRQLAKDGFSDSLGMAADSYGWEGRSEWKLGHPEKAAPCFLNQLALGDESAVVSLKALIPDRQPVEGMLNYGPEADDLEKWSDDQKKTANTQSLLGLKAAAADPLLRRLVTAHVLATETSGPDGFYSSTSEGKPGRSLRWLSVIEAAKPAHLEDAEYLGWIAYNAGDYKAAARWLALADADSPAACWLHAELQLRAGKTADAAKSLSQAWDTLRSPAAYTGWHANGTQDQDYSSAYLDDHEGSWTFPQSASGDLGQIHLARNDFIQALDTFYKGDLRDDAAFVAERVLTADELKAYVDKLGTAPGPENTRIVNLRYLLGRRLVREDRYDEAQAYMKAPYDKILEKYVKALKDGADTSLPKLQRAEAWFTAAWLARYDGMELMGTEVSPDGFDTGGDFPNTDVAAQRLSGKYVTTDYRTSPETTKIHPMPLKPSAQEVHRLETNKIDPDLRYHYRIIAGALALRAAKLMDDNTAELADVLNTAGNWVKDSDDKDGDRIYQILEKRCAKTDTGRAAFAKHWFVDANGPWSQTQQTEYDKMHSQLDIAPPQG